MIQTSINNTFFFSIYLYKGKETENMKKFEMND